MHDEYFNRELSASEWAYANGVICSDSRADYSRSGVISTIADATTIATVQCTPKQGVKSGKRWLSRSEKLNPKNIKKVIFNYPATIIIFTDDTKVISKVHNEEFDEEKGFLMAMSRILFESRAEMNRIIDKGMEDSYK